MAIEVTWFDENNRIIQLQFDNSWDWEELYRAVKYSHNLKDHYLEQGILIVNLTHMTNYKIGLIRHIGKLLDCATRRFKSIIFVGASPLLKDMLMVATQHLKNRIPKLLFVDCLEGITNVSNEVG